MLNGVLRLEDFNLGNVKIKNEDEISIKVKDLESLLARNYKVFEELKEELDEILFTLEMNKRIEEVEKGEVKTVVHSLEEMKKRLEVLRNNG
jgi:hypothetical protein